MDNTQKSILMFAICVGALSLSTYFYYVHFWWSPVVFAVSIVCCVLSFRLLWPLTAEQKAERRAERKARLEKRQAARRAKPAKEPPEPEPGPDSVGSDESSYDHPHRESTEADGANLEAFNQTSRAGQSSQTNQPRPTERVHVSQDGLVTVDVESIAEAQSAKVELRHYLLEYRQKIREAVKQQQEIRARHARDVRIQEAKFKGGVADGRFAKSMVTDARDKARSRMIKELKPIEDARLDFENRIARINDLISQLDKYIVEKKD